MPERLVVAQTVVQRLLERAHRRKEPIVGRTPSQHPPEALDHLELGTVAGQPVHLQLGPLGEHFGAHGPLVPGGVVEHQHHSGVLRGRIGPRHSTQVARKRRLQAALPRCGRLPLRVCSAPLHEARGQVPGHHVERAEDEDQVVTIQVAHNRPMPLEPQRRPPRGDHRAARFILAQPDEFASFGLFLNAWSACRAVSCRVGSALRSWYVGR
jgi:hypothetical protein